MQATFYTDVSSEEEAVSEEQSHPSSLCQQPMIFFTAAQTDRMTNIPLLEMLVELWQTCSSLSKNQTKKTKQTQRCFIERT